MHKEFQPLFETCVLGRAGVRFDANPDLARARFGLRLEQLSARLTDRQWIVGDSFTAADAALATTISFLPSFGIAWRSAHPQIDSWFRRVCLRPSTKGRLDGLAPEHVRASTPADPIMA